MTRRLTSLVSGARPGAQRGALAAAVELGLGYGGWVPSGTVVDEIYRDRVRTSASGSSIMAMRLNVQDSDGTLIVSFARGLAGSAAVIDGIAEGQRKATLHVVLPAGGESGMPDAITTEILEWLAEARISVLNVAGPLEDEEPGIEQATRDLLVWVLEDAVADPAPSDAAIAEVRDIAERHLGRAAVASSGDADGFEATIRASANFVAPSVGAIDLGDRGSVVHAYRCPVHGPFDARVPRQDFPDEMPCPALEGSQFTVLTCSESTVTLDAHPNRCGLTSPSSSEPLGSAQNSGTTCPRCGRQVSWHAWCSLHQTCGECADDMGAVADGDAPPGYGLPKRQA